MAVTKFGCFTQDAADGLPQIAPLGNQTISQPYDPATGQYSIFRVNGQTKLFNRQTTAGASSGGNNDPFALQVKSEFADTDAGHACVESTVDWRANGATGGGVRGLQGVGRLASGKTATGGSIIGTYGQAANNGTLNGAGIMMAGIYSLIEDGGTYTAVSHVASLWVDSHLTKTVTAGKANMCYITNNGTTQMDDVFYVYGGDKISRLFSFDTCAGMIVETPATYSTADGYIAISVDGNAMRIPYFAGSD